MRRKCIIAAAAAVCMAGLSLSGCADGQAGAFGSTTETSIHQSSQPDGLKESISQADDRQDEDDPASHTEPDFALPGYVYTGDDPALQGICEYLISENADKMDGDVYIPVPVILKTEELDQEVLVYGVFWDFWYEQQGDNLFCTGGGSDTGRIRMLREGPALTVSEFEKVRDGGDFVVDLKRICGDDTQLYDTFLTKETREDMREQRRISLVTQYIDDNELPINSYQDYGWEPVRLETRLNTGDQRN